MEKELSSTQKREIARNVSIVSLLTNSGVNLKLKSGRYVCRSPFSEDRHPSMYVYPENTFYDFSTGLGGDAIDFIKSLQGLKYFDAVDYLYDYSGQKVEHVAKPINKILPFNRKFSLMFYKTKSPTYEEIIYEYGDKRGFDRTAYVASFYKVYYESIVPDRTGWNRPCVGFVHSDEEGRNCGIKFRHISDDGQRFSSRGRLAYYVIENVLITVPTIYIVESETSAATLSAWLKKHGHSYVIISFGGVNSIMKTLPFKWNHVLDRKIIIDYDGNEDLYHERLEKFAHLRAKPITLKYEKGEDLNTAILSGEIDKYKDKIIT